MGFALARVAARRGARVLLISGPVPRELGPGPMPANVERIDVVSARQMAEAVHSHVSKADAVVMSAAVADFSPAEVAAEKVKKTDAALELPLEPTEDILATLGARRAAAASLRPLLVGFAMETSQLLPRAKEKLERKGLDLLVANDLTVEGAGFGTETNVVSILHRHGGVDSLPKMDKEAVAGAILDRVVALLAAARMQ
jgi:phosphopantothenoylcysteine decarboxylase/phosphopantothenate--cysteine ligase